MNAGTRTVMALLFAAVAWPASTLAQTVEEFYRGKSITMLVGGGAGGGYDTYARVFARHLSRHIPGNPNIIAKNMPAAAGLAAAGIVHSDLSAFNILVYEDKPYFIDFADAIRVDRTGGVPWVRLTLAREALVHGFRALGNYFRRYGLAIDAEGRANRIIASRDRFGVLSDRTRRPS